MGATEEARVQALDRARVFYTPAEERFDRITRMARRMLELPIALISLVHKEVQWFKSIQGINACETPRSVSFCSVAIEKGELLIVEDATLDPRFSANPLVTGEPFIRFYAGQPLRDVNGYMLGTLCVIGRRPRKLTDEELETLRDLGAMAENELRVFKLSVAQEELLEKVSVLERRSLLDPMTQLWNKGAIMDVFQKELRLCAERQDPLSLMMVDIDRFKGINDTHGHLAGDEIIRACVSRLRGCIRTFDAIGRFGGEEFIVILSNCSTAEALEIGERMRARVAANPFATVAGALPVTISIGITTTTGGEGAEKLIERADQGLYQAKGSGRNRVAMVPAPSGTSQER